MNSPQTQPNQLLGVLDIATGPSPIGRIKIQGWALARDKNLADVQLKVLSDAHPAATLQPSVVPRPDVVKIHGQFVQPTRLPGIEADYVFDGTQTEVQLWATLNSGAQILVDRCRFSNLQRLFFLHVPKTGGTTIKQFLRQHFPVDLAALTLDTDRENLTRKYLRNRWLIAGHISYQSVASRISLDDACTVLILREPQKRLKSHLAHFANYTLLRRRKLYSRMHKINQRFVTRIANEPLRNYYASMDDVFRYNLDNRIVRQLADTPNQRAVTEKDCAIALETLEKLDVIGTMEQIEVAQAHICFHMGWTMPPKIKHANRSPRKRPFDERDSDAVDQLTRFDQIVYERALQLMDNQVSAMCEALSSKLGREPSVYFDDFGRVNSRLLRTSINHLAEKKL